MLFLKLLFPIIAQLDPTQMATDPELDQIAKNAPISEEEIVVLDDLSEIYVEFGDEEDDLSIFELEELDSSCPN